MDEFLPHIANPLTARMHKGINSTLDEGQTAIVTTGAAFDVADEAGPQSASQVQAVALAQNQRDEVRLMDKAGALAAEPGMKQQTYILSGGSKRKDRPGGGFYVEESSVSKPIDTDGVNPTAHQGGVAVAFGRPGNWIGRKPENGGNATEFPEERSPSLTATDRHGVVKAFTASEQSNSYAWERDVYPTLDAQVPNDTSNIQKGVRSDMAVRRLTPHECERLQGFPDGYTDIPGASDSARYKALGNSMAVPVMRWIGERIDAVHKGEDSASFDQ